MRRAWMALLLGSVLAASSAGCFLNMYAAEPARRYQQLFFQSEDLRLLTDDVELFWMIDNPSQLALKRYHGLGDPAPYNRPFSRGPLKRLPNYPVPPEPPST